MGCLQLNLQLSCSESLPHRVFLGNGNRRHRVVTFFPGNSTLFTPRSRQYLRAVGGDHLFVVSQAVPRASSVDYSTFIPLSAGLLFLYWIANFVVPELAITRRFETEADDSSSSSTSNAAEATNPSESNNERQGRQRRRKSSKAR